MRFGRIARIGWLLVAAGAFLCAVTTSSRAALDPLDDLRFTDEWRWSLFGSAEGLPSDHVHELIETTSGVVWARTANGLAWFDDYRWHPVEICGGVSPDSITCFAPGLHDEVMVVGAERLYRGSQSGFTRVNVEDQSRPLAIRSVAPLEEGLLILTRRGIYLMDDMGLRHVPGTSPGENDLHLAKLHRTRSGSIWYACIHGTFL